MGVKSRVRRLEQKTGKEPPVYFLLVHRIEGETHEQAVARQMKEVDLLPGQVLFIIDISPTK